MTSLYGVTREDLYDYLRCPKIVSIKAYQALGREKHKPEPSKCAVEPAALGMIGKGAVKLGFAGVETSTASDIEGPVKYGKLETFTKSTRLSPEFATEANEMPEGSKFKLAEIWVSKSDLAEYLRCPHRLYIKYTEGIRTVDMIESRFRRSLIDAGRKYERDQFATVDWRRTSKKLQYVLSVEKPEAVKEPYLFDVNRHLFGVPDILVRSRGQYLPLEIKSHVQPTKSDRLELAFYATLLEPYLGSRPTEGFLALPPEGLKRPLLVHIESEVKVEILGLIEKVREAKAKAELPAIRSKECYSCVFYETRCLATLSAKRDLTLLHEVGPKLREQLAQQGLHTIGNLAAYEGTNQKLLRIRNAARAFTANQAIVHAKYPLPPPKPTELFLDIECLGNPRRDGMLWSIVLTTRQRSKVTQKQWWADNRREEKVAIRKFMDHVSKIQGDCVLYGYNLNSYDLPTLRTIAEKKKFDTSPIESLIDRSSDLYLYVKDNCSFPFKEKTLKKVIQYIAPERKIIISSGLEACALYSNYLRTKSESTSRRIKRKLLAYTKKDVEDLFVLLDWLRLKTKEVGVAQGRVDWPNESNDNVRYLEKTYRDYGSIHRYYSKQDRSFDHRIVFHIRDDKQARMLVRVLRRMSFKGSHHENYVIIYGNSAVQRFLSRIGQQVKIKLR